MIADHRRNLTRRENRNAPDSPDLSPCIPDDRGYLRFRVFINRPNLGRPGNSKIPDRLKQKKYTAWTVFVETVRMVKSRPRKNQIRTLRFTLPYNKTNLISILYIFQNYVMARFAVLERSKLHQILKTTSISPLCLTYAFVRFSLSLCFVFY